MKINKQKLLKLLKILGAGFAYYIVVLLTGLSVPCPTRTLTGGRILCPGCGISRMFMSLGRLDFRSAFYWHPVALCLLPVWAVCVALWTLDKGKKFVFWTEVVSIVLLLGYTILRNLPFCPTY